MRVDAERCEDLLVELGKLERGPARLDPGTDGHDPVDADGSGAADQRGRPVGAGVEVRVGVDHSEAAACSCILASSSGTTMSGSSFLKSGRGLARAWPGGSSLGAHSPTDDS